MGVANGVDGEASADEFHLFQGWNAEGGLGFRRSEEMRQTDAAPRARPKRTK
jgi:hypothetical protein